MRFFGFGFAALGIAVSALGQIYTIDTLAGGLPVDVPATSAGLGPVVAVAVDPAGNPYMLLERFSIVVRLDIATGVLTLVAGNGTRGFSGDNGPATKAQLDDPSGIVVDSAGAVYIAESNRVRKVSSGVIVTVAGDGAQGFGGDGGPAISAQLNSPRQVAVDSSGNLYILDAGNRRVRKVSRGVITTVAGSGSEGFGGDGGPAVRAQLAFASGIAVDPGGNLYIADSGNSRVRMVSRGVITTVAGNGTGGHDGDLTAGHDGDGGPAIRAQLTPSGVAVDDAGNLYIVDGDRVRKISNGTVTTIVGGTYGNLTQNSDNGPATRAELGFSARGLAVDSNGNVYIADSGTNRLRRVSNGIISTVAGNGSEGFSGENGLAAKTQFSEIAGVAADSRGDVYIADPYNGRIRKISNGVTSTVASNRYAAEVTSNAIALHASGTLSGRGIALDSAGNLYIADPGANSIRKLSNGGITTVAGNGAKGFGGDGGPAAKAELNQPEGVAVDSTGNLYIADTSNNRVRKVSNGVITTLAEDGTAGLTDSGTAATAQLMFPTAVAVDSRGAVYVLCKFDHRIRKIWDGMVSVVAGTETEGFGGDNRPAGRAQLKEPSGIAADSAGNLYIADKGNHRIRRISNGVITTIAGDGTAGFGGDGGPAATAQLGDPTNVAVDPAGKVFIADGDRVRVLMPSGRPCSASVSPAALAVPAAGGTFTVAVKTTGPSCAWAIQDLPDWIRRTSSSVINGDGNAAFIISPNTGAARNATISIAGISVSVSQ